MPVTLLAVDDSVTMRKVLEMTFAGEDYRVLTADSADAALTVARAERPVLVLADATLEGKSGYDLCQALKRELPTVPVLMLSSKLHPYDPAKGQAAHVDDHLDKPFDTQQLIDKVRAMVTAPAAAASPKAPVMAAAPAPAARPPAPPPAAARAPAPAAPAAGARPAAPPAQPSAMRSPVPSNLRQTIAFGGTPSPSAARPPAAPPERAQTRPMATQPQPAPAPARPAPPAAPAAAAHPAPVAAAAVAAGAVVAASGDMSQKLASLGLNKQQIEGVLALSHEVVERVVWEVVPVLAETIIKEEIKRLTAE